MATSHALGTWVLHLSEWLQSQRGRGVPFWEDHETRLVRRSSNATAFLFNSTHVDRVWLKLFDLWDPQPVGLRLTSKLGVGR